MKYKQNKTLTSRTHIKTHALTCSFKLSYRKMKNKCTCLHFVFAKKKTSNNDKWESLSQRDLNMKNKENRKTKTKTKHD